MKIAFFEIKNWEIPCITKNLQLTENDSVKFFEHKLDGSNLPQERDFDIISVFVGSSVDKEIIDAFPNLKLITTRSTGFDHIDLKTAKEKNIAVAYVPGYGDNTVAEFAFGLILTLSRKIYESYHRLRETGSFSSDGLKGFDLAGKTIGIIGTGRIGCHMIKIANGFSMNVLAYDAFPREELCQQFKFKYVPVDELLENSDIISLHVPYLSSTHHLINKNNVSKIKFGAIIINTARGAIIETDALISGLNKGIIAGAGLDVLEEEGFLGDEKSFILDDKEKERYNLKTIIQNHALIDMPNVIVTPHNAFNTQEALQRILNTDVKNIKSFIEKNKPLYAVPF